MVHTEPKLRRLGMFSLNLMGLCFAEITGVAHAAYLKVY